MRTIIVIVLGLFVAACGPKVTTSGTSGSKKYSEDLSTLRKIELPQDTSNTTAPTNDKKSTDYVEARHAINSQLDMVLDSISKINISSGVVDGFTIQLYSGTNRDEAFEAKKQIATAMPQLDSDMQFVQPNFRVRAGKYFTRMDAQKDYLAVKKLFPSAILIPERIPFR